MIDKLTSRRNQAVCPDPDRLLDIELAATADEASVSDNDRWTRFPNTVPLKIYVRFQDTAGPD